MLTRANRPRLLVSLAVLVTAAFLLAGCGPPAPPSPTNAQWTITSTPSGARVFVDGGDTFSVTPCPVTLIAGTHQIELWKDGFERWSRQVYVSAGTPGRADANLVRIPLYPVAVTVYDVNKTRSTAWMDKIRPSLGERILNARIAASHSRGQFSAPFFVPPISQAHGSQPRGTATRSGGSVLTLLQWQASADPAVSQYQIERSADGVSHQRRHGRLPRAVRLAADAGSLQ